MARSVGSLRRNVGYRRQSGLSQANRVARS